MDVRVGRVLVDQVLEEPVEGPEAVPLLELGDDLVHGDQRAHRNDQARRELVGRVGVQQRRNHLGRLARVDLLNVALDVAGHAVGPEEGGHVVHHIEAVADVDQRARVCQLELLEQVLDSLGVKVLRLAGHTLHLGNLQKGQAAAGSDASQQDIGHGGREAEQGGNEEARGGGRSTLACAVLAAASMYLNVTSLSSVNAS